MGEFHHSILHRVERDLLVARREQRLLVSAAFDCREKIRKFLAGSQWIRLSMRPTVAGRFILVTPRLYMMRAACGTPD